MLYHHFRDLADGGGRQPPGPGRQARRDAMTLIPLFSAIVAAPEAITAPTTAPALQVRGSYGAGNRHRPIAALFAVGLPAALVIAAPLSPMIVDDRPTNVTPPWTSRTSPKPPPTDPPPAPPPRTT